MSYSRVVNFYFTVSLFVYYNTYLTVVAEKSNNKTIIQIFELGFL